MRPNPIVERLSVETIKAKSTLIAELALKLIGMGDDDYYTNDSLTAGDWRRAVEKAVTLALMADHPPED